VSALVAELPRYTVIKQKYDVPKERMGPAVEAVTEAFSEHKPNTADGVRVDFPDGWVHLRSSNTEPIMRIIGEAQTDNVARQLVDKVQRVAGL
jgi:phosphomannomutase